MDDGPHFLENAEPLQSFNGHFSIHTPCRGTNFASVLEPIRRASVEVMGQCSAMSDGDVGGRNIGNTVPKHRPRPGGSVSRTLAKSVPRQGVWDGEVPVE